MKKWLYFPHDLLALSDVKLMNLIEKGGLEMYGAYWVLIEHLRAQDGYRSDLSAIRSIARKVKISYTKLMKVVTDFDLFIVEEGSFFSTGLIKRMEPYDVKKDKSSENGKKGAAAKALKNSSTNSSEGEANRVEKSKVENKKTSYSEGKKVATVCDDTKQKKTEQLPVSQWEYYIDQAFEDELWIGLVGRQSALEERFEDNQLLIAQCFKDHVRLMGSETNICSLQDAKSYFSNFIRPGATTRPRLEQRLREELRSENPYPYEDYNPKTGIRSCFGIVIPSNAPPRPDCSVRWNQERNGWTN